MAVLTVPVPGAELNVVDEGNPSNPPVLLLHAGIADLRSWDGLASRLVEAGYRVARFDARGAGRTESRVVDFSRVDDTLAVLDALGVDRAVLVGNSLGGQTAIDTAIVAPDRVAAVVGVAAGISGFEAPRTELEASMFDEMDALDSADPPDPAAIADIDIRVWVDGPGQPPDRVPASIRDLVRDMDMGSYAPGRETGGLIRLDPPAASRLGDLRCPLLAVAGELDVSSAVAAARHLEANAPNARAVIWPDVAHLIGLEVPDRLAALIVEFVAPLPRWG
jgi:pimeloyl-ACP methyl ester carboxylesterase